MILEPEALLEAMLRIPSLSGHEGELARFLADTMRRAGFRAHVDEAGNAIGERGSGPRQVMLLGHMDTVPGEVPLRRDGDRLYGRGAVDAKGPLAAFIAAAAAVAVPPDVTLVVAGAVEEEAATSKGARHLLDRYRPDAVVIGEPSGWESITVGYKGRLLIDFDWERGAAHSARGEASVSEAAVGFWLWVKEFADAYGAGEERQFDRVDAGLRSIVSKSDGMTDCVRMTVALRLPPGFDADRLAQAATLAAGPATLRLHGHEQAYRAGRATAPARAFQRAIRAVGGEPRFSLKMGTSDMNVVGPVWACPIVAYGPGDSDLDHTPDEHISITELQRAVAVLEKALAALMG